MKFVKKILMVSLILFSASLFSEGPDGKEDIELIEEGQADAIDQDKAASWWLVRKLEGLRIGFSARVKKMPPWLLDSIVSVDTAGEAIAYGYLAETPENYTAAAFVGVVRGMCLADFLSNHQEWKKAGTGLLMWLGTGVVNMLVPGSGAITEGLAMSCTGLMAQACYRMFLKATSNPINRE